MHISVFCSEQKCCRQRVSLVSGLVVSAKAFQIIDISGFRLLTYRTVEVGLRFGAEGDMMDNAAPPSFTTVTSFLGIGEAGEGGRG